MLYLPETCIVMKLCIDCCMQLLIMKGWWAESQHGEFNGRDSPQSEDQLGSSNWRQSEPLLSEDLWNGKGKKRKVLPLGIESRAYGLSRQCSATEPRHPPTTTPPSSPFITLLWVISDVIKYWLLRAIVDQDCLRLDDLHRSSDCGGVPSNGLSMLWLHSPSFHDPQLHSTLSTILHQ